MQTPFHSLRVVLSQLHRANSPGSRKGFRDDISMTCEAVAAIRRLNNLDSPDNRLAMKCLLGVSRTSICAKIFYISSSRYKFREKKKDVVVTSVMLLSLRWLHACLGVPVPPMKNRRKLHPI